MPAHYLTKKTLKLMKAQKLKNLLIDFHYFKGDAEQVFPNVKELTMSYHFSHIEGDEDKTVSDLPCDAEVGTEVNDLVCVEKYITAPEHRGACGCTRYTLWATWEQVAEAEKAIKAYISKVTR